MKEQAQFWRVTFPSLFASNVICFTQNLKKDIFRLSYLLECSSITCLTRTIPGNYLDFSVTEGTEFMPQTIHFSTAFYMPTKHLAKASAV